MNMEMMPPPLESEEQPTFDMTGFDNPLYDTYVQVIIYIFSFSLEGITGFLHSR